MSAQNTESTIFYSDYVECYFDKAAKQPLYIYDSFDGKVIDTIYNLENKNAWLKLAIADSEFGWLKIKNLQRFPEAQKDYNYQNYWVRSANFLIMVDNYNERHKVYVYEYASMTSNKIHKVDNFQIVNVIETKDLWAKVSFMVDKKQVRGWLPYRDQCAYPWTTCPKQE